MTAKKAKAPTLGPVEAFCETTLVEKDFAVKDTTAKKQDQDLPSFRQAVNMALKMTTSVMTTLASVRLADTQWDDDDCDADFSIDLARRELERLSAAKDLTETEFFRSWWQIYSVVSLADKAFKRDCIFKNHLQCFPESFRVLGEMVELSTGYIE